MCSTAPDGLSLRCIKNRMENIEPLTGDMHFIDLYAYKSQAGGRFVRVLRITFDMKMPCNSDLRMPNGWAKILLLDLIT